MAIVTCQAWLRGGIAIRLTARSIVIIECVVLLFNVNDGGRGSKAGIPKILIDLKHAESGAWIEMWSVTDPAISPDGPMNGRPEPPIR